MKRLFVDVETTGTDQKKCAIHQLSGYIEIDENLMEYFDFKIKPFEGALITEEALNVAHVTLEQIMQYPPETEAYAEFKNILARHSNQYDKKDKFSFVGYNAFFDIQFCHEFFLRNEDVFWFGLVWSSPIDVMVLAFDYLEDKRSEMENFQLVTVAKKLDIEIEEKNLHNSMYDIELTREVYKKVKGRQYREDTKIQEKEIKKDFPPIPEATISAFINSSIDTDKPVTANIQAKGLQALIKIDSENYNMTFGKHRGCSIGFILRDDPGYIIWLHDNTIKGIIVDREILSKAIKNKNDPSRERNFDDDLPF